MITDKIQDAIRFHGCELINELTEFHNININEFGLHLVLSDSNNPTLSIQIPFSEIFDKIGVNAEYNAASIYALFFKVGADPEEITSKYCATRGYREDVLTKLYEDDKVVLILVQCIEYKCSNETYGYELVNHYVTVEKQ